MEVQADCSKFCRKLEEFRQEKLHCDVDLQVGQQVFPCHRVVISAASYYFSSMFSGKFMESKKKKIVLNDMDEAIFEDILSFIYTGKITVTSENSYQLLVASQYLGLQFIEDLCTSYLTNNIPVNNAIEIFIFAFKTGKTLLLGILSVYIAENVATFCNESKFLEIPYDAVKMIFNAADQRDALLYAIIRWVRHSYHERKQVVPELLKKIDFEKVSAAYVQLLTECVIEAEPAHQNLHDKCGNSYWLPAAEGASEDKNLLNISPLNVYVASELVATSFLHRYGVDNKYQWHNVGEVEADKNILNCKNVAVGEKLHSFYHFYYKSDKTDPYLRHKYRHNISRSTDMHSYKSARYPPCDTAHFDACNVQTNIYFCNRALSNTDSSLHCRNFTTEEISRGIYSYNCDVDRWYPVAKQKLKLDGSHLVSCNDVVYLLGGYSVTDKSFDRGYVQSYDHRMATWSELPDTTLRYKDAAAGVHDGKIYIAGGSCYPRGVEVFDPKAGKWETVKPMNCGRISHKLTSYNNYLWAIGHGTDLSVEIYDQKANHWINATSIAKAVKGVADKTPDCWFSHKVLDAVVFEYYKTDQMDEDDDDGSSMDDREDYRRRDYSRDRDYSTDRDYSRDRDYSPN